jgi:hypothetical protein
MLVVYEANPFYACLRSASGFYYGFESRFYVLAATAANCYLFMPNKFCGLSMPSNSCSRSGR